MDRRLSASTWGLIALALVVAALVGFAISPPSPPDSTVQAFPSQPASPSATTEPSTTPTETGESATPEVTSDAPSEAILLDVTTRRGPAVRGLAGDCEAGGAMLELSDDGGATWDEVKVPTRGLLRVKAVSASETWIIGTDRGCNARFIRTTDGGSTWTTRTGTAGAWHLLPPGATQLHAPINNVDSPCEGGMVAVDLAVLSDANAALLCADGRVHSTRDSGAAWQRGGEVKEATALAFSNATTGFAAAPGGDACDGTLVSRSTDAGATWDERGCVEGAASGVSLAFSSNTAGLLATVNEVWRTLDAGQTWTRQ